ncbi:uncharacterized protein NPIL_247731 [Nephila pilipes]|uniref:Nucleolar protein 8 n=1 Tax=Nephila pilipes TaxID=299642 RepID=A0A8X6JQ30_NEPPI|nr:uncharacterized protein NPIL_247731 [Nephila pilipes]
MDPVEKKRLANEKRLKAIQEWKNRNQQLIKIEPKSVRTTFEEPSEKSLDKNKLTLFDSDEDEDNYEDDFSIRPQFEGEKGQYLLEKNAEFSSRFKLDERFKDDDNEEISENIATQEKEEKIKNMKILESVLGYEVIEKYPDGRKPTKRQQMVRFDPEDENASEYLKTREISVKEPPKKVRKKQVVEEEATEKPIPISTERYIEVSSNLKDLINSSATSFSLSEKFSTEVDIESNSGFNFSFSTKEDLLSNEVNQKEDIKASNSCQEIKNIFQNRKKFLFFISKDADVLKEGVDFFRRKSTLEEIYEGWNERKAYIMEIFRKKRKNFKRKSITKGKASERNKAHKKK